MSLKPLSPILSSNNSSYNCVSDSSEEKSEKIEDFLYGLGPDIVSIILKDHLNDPRDLISLWNTDKWLRWLIKESVKELYVSPEEEFILPLYMLDRFPKLKSLRCDVRIYESEDICYLELERPEIKNLCFHISSRDGPTILSTISYLMIDSLKYKRYRMERWNYRNSTLDTVWIGEGKLCHGANDDYFVILILYKNYIKELLTEGTLFDHDEYTEVVADLPYLEHIYYVDCGYLPCRKKNFKSMLLVSDYLKSIVCIPCDYYYRTNEKIKWKHIDKFVNGLVDDYLTYSLTYDNIERLVIPMDIRDVFLLDDVFPNLTSVGFRYVHSVQFMDEQYVNLTPIHHLQKRYEEITVFLYLEFKTAKIRQEINRNLDCMEIISRRVSDIIKMAFPRIKVINMDMELPSLLVARDNWLFSNDATRYLNIHDL